MNMSSDVKVKEAISRLDEKLKKDCSVFINVSVSCYIQIITDTSNMYIYILV